MTENMKQFLELVETDAGLKAEMNGLNDIHDGKEADEQSIAAMRGKIIQMAGQRGITLTTADFEANSEMTEDELAQVAGGGDPDPAPSKGICICPVIGAGAGLGSTKGECGCGVVGTGGNGSTTDYNCVCVGGGYGG